MIKKTYTILVLAFLICISSGAFADVYSFDIFTSNGDWGVGGSNENDSFLNISVDVYNGAGVTKFKFMNNSDESIGSSITDIYFDDGSLLGISSITNQDDIFGLTSFSQPASPSELPGASLLDPDFVTSNNIVDETLQYFSVDSDAPPSHNGVQSGEWVIIQFDLIGSGTIQDVIDELNDGRLRIGIHIQSFTDGSSESAVNVPEPTTILLLGLGSLVLIRKRK